MCSIIFLLAMLLLFAVSKRAIECVGLGTMVLGGGCNLLAVWSNGGAMPVKWDHRKPISGHRHKHMYPWTKFKLLCDVIDTKFGVWSIGDFILIAGFLTLTIGRHY